MEREVRAVGSQVCPRPGAGTDECGIGRDVGGGRSGQFGSMLSFQAELLHDYSQEDGGDHLWGHRFKLESNAAELQP